MPDRVETELKFIVHDPDALRSRLIGLGAVAKGRHAEENIRLDDGSRRLASQKTVLRLRRVERDAGIRYILTVKTPGAPGGAFKSRREIELEVSDGPAMLTALGVLGFAPYMRYEKRREVFGLDGVEADLDELPYGWFLELEGPAQATRVMAARLGLDPADGLTASYAEIFDSVRAGMKLEMADLTFAAFEGIAVDPRFYTPR